MLQRFRWHGLLGGAVRRLQAAPAMWRGLAIALCALALGCRSGSLAGLSSDWSAQPSRVDFGTVYLGNSASAPLTLQSATRARVSLTLAVEAPFEAPAELTLEGGATLEAPVTFRPERSGRHSAVARLSDGAREHFVLLEGEASPMPVCAPRDACHTAAFDPALGACAQTPLPDGTACADACLTAGACFGGTCIGAQKTCDDGNACTLDSCDPTLGCVHTDASAQCPGSSDPCQVPVCDPGQGCGLAPAADGTRCGPSDCTTSQVCMAGQCETRPTPEGAVCQPAGVCQAASTCRGDVCVAGAVTMLPERWRYAPAGKRLFFEGTVGPDGTAYFTESSRTDPTLPLELVAVRPDGAVAWRAELERGCAWCGSRLMLDPEGDRIFVGRGGGVQARRMRDGALLWSRDSWAGKVPRSPKPDGGVQLSTSAFIALSPQVMVQQLSEGYELHRDYSVALDRATGQVLWERDFWGHVYFPGATAADELWVTAADCWAPIQQSLVLAANGATAGTVVRQARPIGFLGDKALLSNNSDFVWASAQGVGPPLPLPPLGYPWALLSPERTVLAAYDGVREMGPDGGVLWARNFPGYIATGALLEDGGSLFTARTPDAGSMLWSLDRTGADVFACPMPGAATAGSPAAGLWIAHLGRGNDDAIVAFETPGVALAPRGWVTPAGSPRNDRRAR